MTLRIAACALALAMQGAAATDIRTAAQQGGFPKYVQLKDGARPAIGGLCVDIMRAIERAEPGLRFVGDQEWRPSLRVDTALADGQIDAACGMLRTPKRDKLFHHIETPLFPVTYYLAVRADDQVKVANWNDVRKLGEKGIVLSNHGFEGVLAHMQAQGGILVDSGGHNAQANLTKLLAGRGRFFIHRSPGIEAEIARPGFDGKVKLLPAPMYTENFYMLVPKSMAPELRQKMNAAIVHIHASGELGKLVKKWSGPHPAGASLD
ncbi:MAG: transporter substrate-binding domain-containing protein [Pseudomonadota bacterium]